MIGQSCNIPTRLRGRGAVNSPALAQPSSFLQLICPTPIIAPISGCPSSSQSDKNPPNLFLSRGEAFSQVAETPGTSSLVPKLPSFTHKTATRQLGYWNWLWRRCNPPPDRTDQLKAYLHNSTCLPRLAESLYLPYFPSSVDSSLLACRSSRG